MMLVVNQDNDNYFKYPSEYMTEESLCRFVDFYAENNVSHIFFCACGQRTSFRSKVWDAIWDPQKDGSISDDIWAQNCLALYNKGIDPYSVWIRRCREKGISPFISVRLNDVHHADNPDNFRSTSFWREHPELHRVPFGKSRRWADHAFDFSKQAAYEYALAIVREVIERYDADGYEMDWMRWPACLTPGKELEQSPVLVEFMKDVSRIVSDAAARRKHPITLAVRVPPTPEIAVSKGFDVKRFVEEAGVKIVTVSPFFNSSDPDLSSKSWRDYLGSAAEKITLLPAIDDGSSQGAGLPRISNTAAVLRGWADTMLADGFDGLYFFNFSYITGRENEHPFGISDPAEKIFRSVNTLQQEEKRYVISFRDMAGPDNMLIQLPANLPAKLEFRNGLAPKNGKISVELEFRLEKNPPYWEKRLLPKVEKVLFNGDDCTFSCHDSSCCIEVKEDSFRDHRNTLEVFGTNSLQIINAALVVK